MGKAQLDHPRYDGEAERGPRFQPVRQRRQRGAAATLAVTGILLHPRDDRLDLRQIDLVVAGGQRVIVRMERGLAVGAAHRTRDHRLVGVLRQQSSAALPPEAALARAFTFGPVGAIGFLALRGRHGGVVRRLRRSTQLGLELGNPRRQYLNLRRQRLNLRPQRSDQRVLFVMREAAEVGKLGHPKLESWPPWSRQWPFDPAAYIPSTGGDEQIPFGRWEALTRYADDGRLAIDNNV